MVTLQAVLPVSRNVHCNYGMWLDQIEDSVTLASFCLGTHIARAMRASHGV